MEAIVLELVLYAVEVKIFTVKHMLDVQTFKVTKSAKYVSNNEIDQTNTSRMWPRL